jgi:hypothetical protein
MEPNKKRKQIKNGTKIKMEGNKKWSQIKMEQNRNGTKQKMEPNKKRNQNRKKTRSLSIL